MLIIGQYLWPSWNAPRYTIPMISSAGLAFSCIVGAWIMRWMLVRENRKIRASDSEARLFYAY